MSEPGDTLQAEPEAPRQPAGRLPQGVAVIRRHLEVLGREPGVYRMLGDEAQVLYVGKAKNLKSRVAAYARPERLPVRIQRMVAETRAMEFMTTRSEVEALLLESNLIKKLRPRYNILLRDDNALPAIVIRQDHSFPQVMKHRGARTLKGDYFGPFASAGAVNAAIDTLQRAFRLRTCTDAVFAHRSRPCLQYQIKRCAAPCVGYVSERDYAATVAQASAYLAGRSTAVQADLAREMQAASARLDFEKAAELRDRIRALTQLQAQQDINIQDVRDANVIALAMRAGRSCVQTFFFRGGRNNGNHSWRPDHGSDRASDWAPRQILAAFLGQFYARHPPPPLLLCSHRPDDHLLLEKALSERAGCRVRILTPVRGDKRKLVAHALTNAQDALERTLAASASWTRMLEGLQRLFELPSPVQRVEAYDNSHIQGRNAVGAMIVAGPEGFMKSAYRKFNIRTVAPGAEGGDDYAMMREVMTRRFSRVMREDPERRQEGAWPDLVLLDGGQGHLNAARDALAELGLAHAVAIAAIAKGPEREAGRERIHLPDRSPFMLAPRDPVLYCLQRLRDESHRFALGAHRKRRHNAMRRTSLDDIPGIGAKRKRALLTHFGSAKAVTGAGVADLQAVSGISEALARNIHVFLHPED